MLKNENPYNGKTVALTKCKEGLKKALVTVLSIGIITISMASLVACGSKVTPNQSSSISESNNPTLTNKSDLFTLNKQADQYFAFDMKIDGEDKFIFGMMVNSKTEGVYAIKDVFSNEVMFYWVSKENTNTNGYKIGDFIGVNNMESKDVELIKYSSITDYLAANDITVTPDTSIEEIRLFVEEHADIMNKYVIGDYTPKPSFPALPTKAQISK